MYKTIFYLQMNSGKIVVLAAYFFTALLAVAFARDYYSTDKRAQGELFF